jgi:hypothetical protein
MTPLPGKSTREASDAIVAQGVIRGFSNRQINSPIGAAEPVYVQSLDKEIGK